MNSIHMSMTRNQFVRQLATLQSAPTVIVAEIWPESVTWKDADLAIKENDSHESKSNLLFNALVFFITIIN